MAVIEKIRKQGIDSEIIIKFSLRHKRFEIEFSDKSLELTKIDKSLFYFNDYNLLENNLNLIQVQYLSEHRFEKKQIVISLKTSVSPQSAESKMFGNDEKLNSGSGFSLDWYIVEKYLPHPIKGHARPLELFRIIETAPNSNKNLTKKPNIFGQIFFSDPVRVIEYSDELYDFLKSVDAKIEGLCNQLYTFFDKDQAKFLDNINNNSFKLLK